MTDSLPFLDRLPTATGAPVRKIVRRSHPGYVAALPSTKCHIPLECESLLELDFARLCEVDRRVQGMLHQPCEIFWLDEHREKHRHVPDFALQRDDGRFLVEVKPWAKTLDPWMIMRRKAVAAMLARYGIKYRVITDRMIRSGPALTNAKVVLKGLGVRPLPEEREAVLQAVGPASPGIALGRICQRLALPDSFCNGVLSMVIGGELEIVAPSTQPLPDVPSIVVRRRNGARP